MAVNFDTPRSLRNIRRAFQRKWYTAIERFRASAAASGGNVAALQAAASELEAAWHATIDTGWNESFRLGAALRTGAAPREVPDAFTQALRSQKEFASGFARDLVAGRPRDPWRMNVGPRSNLYASALAGPFNSGLVTAGPPGEVITWVLGAADHCDPCPVIASSGPYTRDGSGGYPALPTYPGAGATPCLSNCKCHLEFSPGRGAPVAVASAPPFVDFALSAPDPPPGRRRPNDDEALWIRDMENRMNFARRKIAETVGTPDQRMWIQERRKANGNLIDFKSELKIWSPPRFSVSEVVSGRDVPMADVRNITQTRGLDGRTINRATAERVRRALDETRKTFEETLAKLPADAEEIPDIRAMFRALGYEPLSEARVIRESFESMPTPGTLVVNALGRNARSTIEAHLQAIQLLSEQEFDIDIGPVGDNWFDLAMIAGTWIMGPPDQVRAFLAAWSKRSVVAVAPWTPA